jgi:class 3 adenylate cyclase/tetratricopeptide (TPR) repeat protein
MSTVVCPNCGQENRAEARFCDTCGAVLKEAPTSAREERKVVTVLFCDLVGFTSRAEQLDPEDVRGLLQPYHARLKSELERFGGTVEKFIGDAAMAVFGAPVVHEDDAERAVRAALVIRDWASDEGIEVRIAVNTGEALVSVDARAEAGEAMVAGDVVNTAARVQSAAPVNGILVGETTWRATERSIEYRESKLVAAKGKRAPVPVWEAVQARARVGVELVGRAVPLVGRERELELLAAALDRARREHEPQLATLVGVPGIGKSRLVAELFGLVEQDAELITWRRGRSLPYGEATPLFAFAEMVKAQAGILDTDKADDAAGKLRQATSELLGDEAGWVTERLRPLVGLETGGIAGGDARAQSFAAWRQFVEALAEESPTVLVFEDLHWADDDLLDFVDHIIDWASDVALLVVATARPELVERRPGWGGGKRNALTISLGPLAETETARLLAALLGRAVLPAETQTALLARAAGNPLYAEQFAAMVAERSDSAGVPETLQGIIAARLDALAAEDKRLLQAAAVFGRQFWLGAVVAVEGVERSEAEERLHALQRKEFVRRERRSSVAGETEFTFAHLLVRDVAYGQIPRAQRIEKHRAAAEWIESLAPDRSEDRADMLAHHYLAALELAEATAGDTAEFTESARRALRDAAERALSLGAFPAAGRLYARALELWPEHDEDRPVAVLRQAEAIFYALGRPDVDALLQAAAALTDRGESALAAKAEIIAAVTFWWAGKGDETEAHAWRALELVRDAPSSPEKATVLVERARLLMVGSREEEALAIGREGLEMAEKLGLDNVVASVLITIGAARFLLGDANRGAIDLERGVELAVQIKAAQQIQRGHVNLAELRRLHGHLSEAAQHYRAARPFGEQYGEPYGLRWLDTADCEMDYLAGEWASAEARATAFIAEAEAGAPYYTENTARSVRAEIRWARGDVAGALEDAEAGLRSSREIHDAQALGPSLATLARLLVHEGRTEEATPLVDELLALAGDHGGFPHFFWIVDSARLARDTGRLDAWWTRASNEPRSPYVEIGEAVARGDDAAAAELFAAKGHVTEAAYAHLRAAETLAGEGRRADAKEHARSALEFYASVGASAYVRRGESLLAVSA